jgi:hypothetical protein
LKVLAPPRAPQQPQRKVAIKIEEVKVPPVALAEPKEVNTSLPAGTIVEQPKEKEPQGLHSTFFDIIFRGKYQFISILAESIFPKLNTSSGKVAALQGLQKREVVDVNMLTPNQNSKKYGNYSPDEREKDSLVLGSVGCAGLTGGELCTSALGKIIWKWRNICLKRGLTQISAISGNRYRSA